VLFWLYWNKHERWQDGSEQRWSALWPLYVYSRDVRGVKSFSFPAPVEPILNKDGIERNWAPLWRIYQQKWTDNGDSAVSFLWNLYWHEIRGDSIALELFPLVAYRGESQVRELSFLKGLVRYRSDGPGRRLSLFWLPWGLNWGLTSQEVGQGSDVEPAAGGGEA
jgi:hypothetical protein